MLESLDNVSGHPGRSNLDLAGIPRKLTFNLANLSGHPGRKMYPGRDRIAWSGYNPPVSNLCHAIVVRALELYSGHIF